MKANKWNIVIEMTAWTHLGSPEEKVWGMKSLLMLPLKLTCSVTENKTLLNLCFQPNTEGAAPSTK